MLNVAVYGKLYSLLTNFPAATSQVDFMKNDKMELFSSKEFKKKNAFFDLSQYPVEIYFLTVNSTDSKMTYRVIKE